MRLWILDTLSLQLVLLPFYLLCVMSFFMLHFPRRAVLYPSEIRISADHVLVYSLRYVFTLAIPFLVLLFMCISSVRGVDSFFCMSQLYVSSWLLKYFFLSFFFSAVVALFSLSLFKTTLPYIFEIAVSLIWLFWCFFWVFSVTNLAIFIFFLEIFGLLLLVALLYTFVIFSRQNYLITLNNKLFNTAYSSKFYFIQTLLFFLWSSAISMLLLFWGCLFLGLNCLSLDLTLVELFYNFSILSMRCSSYGGPFSVYLTMFLFFFAVLLKGAIVPVQAWLVIFYKHLPITGLFIYLTFYYIYFLFIIFNLLFGYLYAFTAIWLCAATALFSISILFAIFSVSEAFTFRNFIAYSSIINLFFLFIFLLSGFDNAGISINFFS